MSEHQNEEEYTEEIGEEFWQQFSPEAEEERRRRAFRDFLIAPRISGTDKAFAEGMRIPQERIRATGQRVEVAKILHEEDDKEHEDSLIILHRNRYNEIESVEVRCTCGKKTIIHFGQKDEGRDAGVELDDDEELIGSKDFAGVDETSTSGLSAGYEAEQEQSPASEDISDAKPGTEANSP